MNTKLLPCPFCGKIPDIQKNIGQCGYITPSVFIKCCYGLLISEQTEKYVQGEGYHDVTDTAINSLIDKWNTRNEPRD